MMISVIIPLYNKEEYIRQALESVLQQSYQDFEIVVVNDGSTDGSLAKAQQVQDGRIRIITQKNGGVSAARNRGIEEARGEYVAFLDADDKWNDDYLATQAGLIGRYPQCAVFATNYVRVRDGRTFPTVINQLTIDGDDGVLTNYFYVASHSDPPICSSAVICSRKAIMSIGGFPVGVTAGEDLLTWARLAVKFKIAYSKKVCAQYMLPSSKEAQRPTRHQDEADPVGAALEQLHASYPQHKALKAYIAFWHKMRAVNALGFCDMKEVRKETCLSLRYNAIQPKMYAIGLLSFMPHGVAKRLYKRYVQHGGAI